MNPLAALGDPALFGLTSLRWHAAPAACLPEGTVRHRVSYQ